MKKLTLFIFLSLGLTSFSHAGYLDDWTDDQICGWMENPSPPEHMVQEAVKRNLDCAPESAKKKAQEDTGLQIMIYDADFSDSDLDELSQTDLNKTDFDFSSYNLANNHRNLECLFYIEETLKNQPVEEKLDLGLYVNYSPNGPWTIAKGSLVIDSGEVKINEGSRWGRGGLSTDPKYLRDEVNLRLTEDGYLVGKMAYFEWVGDGEPPKLPIYPRLLKHKKSIPLNYKNPTKGSAKFWLEKTLDWSDGLLQLNNCKMYEENYKDGKLEGKQTTWYQIGEIKSEVNYKDGKKEGKSTTWYQGGKIQLEVNYRDGQKDGKATSWYKNGQKKSDQNYINGKREFQSTSWYQNGQVETQENYKDSKMTSWYPSGEIKSEVYYKNSKRHGKDTSWYMNGQKKAQQNYINGKKEGKSTVWYQSSQKNSEVNYKDNKINGKQTKWYENGQIKSEGNYKAGKTGFSVFNGAKEGKFTTWYENGQIKSEEAYIENKREGKRTAWYDNGQKMYEDNFKNGKLDGKKINWNKNGQKESETNYKDGILIL